MIEIFCGRVDSDLRRSTYGWESEPPAVAGGSWLRFETQVNPPATAGGSDNEANMKYMLLIYHDETLWHTHTEPERQEIYHQYRALIEELTRDGKYLVGDQLQPTVTANSVRVRENRPLVTDGPFAETREQLGGFFLVEAKDIAEANAIAARIPSALTGTIEVRPVVEATVPRALAAD